MHSRRRYCVVLGHHSRSGWPLPSAAKSGFSVRAEHLVERRFRTFRAYTPAAACFAGLLGFGCTAARARPRRRFARTSVPWQWLASRLRSWAAIQKRLLHGGWVDPVDVEDHRQVVEVAGATHASPTDLSARSVVVRLKLRPGKVTG